MFELTSVLVAIETSAVADWIGGPIYPVISALHILALSFVIAPILLADIRIISLGYVDQHSKWLSRIALVGFAGAALTGALLLSVQATRYAENPAVTLKFVLLGVAGINAFCFFSFQNMRRTLAATSAMVWLGVLVSGRWIAFAS